MTGFQNVLEKGRTGLVNCATPTTLMGRLKAQADHWIALILSAGVIGLFVSILSMLFVIALLATFVSEATSFYRKPTTRKYSGKGRSKLFWRKNKIRQSAEWREKRARKWQSTTRRSLTGCVNSEPADNKAELNLQATTKAAREQV